LPSRIGNDRYWPKAALKTCQFSPKKRPLRPR
jgi:hypothetical protein